MPPPAESAGPAAAGPEIPEAPPPVRQPEVTGTGKAFPIPRGDVDTEVIDTILGAAEKSSHSPAAASEVEKALRSRESRETK